MNNVRVTYLRDKNNRAFGCLAVKLDCKSNKIYYSISVCHSKSDTYDKLHGYHKAVGRLNNTPMVIDYVKFDSLGAHGITRHVMYDILQRREIVSQDLFGDFTVQEGLPTRVRKYAKGWLRNYNCQIPVTVVLEAAKPSTNKLEAPESWRSMPDRRSVG